MLESREIAGKEEYFVKEVINELGEKIELFDEVSYHIQRNEEPPMFSFMNEMEYHLKETLKGSI